MSYEDAPSTTLLATDCASCGRPLVDAESVTAGMGPDCRKKFGLPNTLDDEARAAANKLVYLIALAGRDCDDVRDAIAKLDAMGCTKLVDRVSKRFYGDPVEAELKDARLVIRSPYHDGFTTAIRRIKGRAWSADEKANTFEPDSWPEVEAAIVRHYPGRRAKVATAPTPVCAGMLAALCGSVKPKVVTETPIKVVRDKAAGRVAVFAPYDRGLIEDIRSIDGRRWDAEAKANTFPIEAEESVLICVRAAFARVHVVTEEGAVSTPRRGRRRAVW